MATQILVKDVVVPAGTAIATPATLDASFPPMVTEIVEWAVPKGSAGLMGFRLVDNTGQIVPTTPGAWIIAHGESASWRLENLHTSGKWQVAAYNLGTFDHVIHLRFHVSPIGGTGPTGGPFAWLAAGRVTRSLLDIGGMANTPEYVTLPRSILWPPPGRG